MPVVVLKVREVPAGQHNDKAGAPERSVHVREQLVDDADPAERSAAREDAGNDHEDASEETVYPEGTEHTPLDERSNREDDQGHQDDPVDDSSEIASHWSGIPRRMSFTQTTRSNQIPGYRISYKS